MRNIESNIDCHGEYRDSVGYPHHAKITGDVQALRDLVKLIPEDAVSLTYWAIKFFEYCDVEFFNEEGERVDMADYDERWDSCELAVCKNGSVLELEYFAKFHSTYLTVTL